MSLKIRKASVEDAPILERFMRDLWDESLDVIFRRPAPQTIEEIEKFIRTLDATPNSILLVALLDERILAILDLHGSAHQQRRHCAVFGMSVAKPWRRQGIGKAMIEAMVDYARSTDDLTRIELQVFEGNAPAIRLYERMGFELEGRRRSAVRIGESYIDALMMAMLLR
jgi:RimJ/RimL family protein N-acetyltransferase